MKKADKVEAEDNVAWKRRPVNDTWLTRYAKLSHTDKEAICKCLGTFAMDEWIRAEGRLKDMSQIHQSQFKSIIASAIRLRLQDKLNLNVDHFSFAEVMECGSR